MDWKKAKRIMISVLVILNICLLFMNFKNVSRYYVTPQREKEIVELLSKNGIGLYSELIKFSPPMRSISVKSNETDTGQLKKIFFDENEDVKISVLFNKTILSSGDKTLTTENDITVFNAPTGILPPKTLSYETAKETVTTFMQKNRYFDKFRSENIAKKDDGYIFQYFEEYDGHKIFGSYSKFFVTEKGIEKIIVTNYDIEGYVGEKRDIFACDEALFTFLKQMKTRDKKGVFIEKAELGYDFRESESISKEGMLKLVPCYYIYLSNSDSVYIVEAYDNRIK